MKEFIYKIIDTLTLGRGIKRHISGFTVTIPTRYYKYFESDYELNNINFLHNYVEKGMIIIDVGAHIGLLSIIMADKVGATGKIISFEPTPSTFAILQKTIAINEKKNIITPIRKAISDKPGKTYFYVTDIDAHNSNSLSNNNRDYGNEHKIDIDLTSIDELKTELKLPTIDLIKIDAEGAELSVLKGASNVIQQHMPKIILALHPASIINFGNSLSEIWDFIAGYNYTVYYKNDKITKEFFINYGDLFDVFLIPNN
ncbi:MAG TPA: FkbM family methyltransferase [Ferruginibacter sp.]|jgi:FkbM family methyltransferase|nr:FkbM family methyltransferase [Ferruginibacter sp.]